MGINEAWGYVSRMSKSQLGRKYWPSRATEWDLSVSRGLRDGHHLLLRDCRQRVLFLVFGLRIFLSGERNCSVTRSVGEAPSRDHSVCRGSWASLPKQLPWQPPTLRKSTLANQLTMQATFEHLFLMKKWVQDAAHNRGQCVLLCHTVRHGGQICHL